MRILFLESKLRDEGRDASRQKQLYKPDDTSEPKKDLEFTQQFRCFLEAGYGSMTRHVSSETG
jgi:hypothetical protein